MQLLKSITGNAAFNLALEEHLLHTGQGDYILLSCSNPAVVVGKHQNALAEANIPWVTQRSIPVIRRISGGGTVFHGPGNVNFSVIRQVEQGRQIDFVHHTLPIIWFLEELGVPARFSGKNDIRVDGAKISGNAAHVYKRRVLHHGTLLYDADLDMLRASINVNTGKYTDKSIQSVRSRVANVSAFLDTPPSFAQFVDMLASALSNYYGGTVLQSLPGDEVAEVQTLVAEKYNRWEWNFGYSPPYAFTGCTQLGAGALCVQLNVRNGVIENVRLSGDAATDRWRALEKTLPGNRHEARILLSVLQSSGIVDAQKSQLPQELFSLFF